MDRHQMTSDALAAAPKVAAAGGLVAFADQLDPWVKILGFVFIVLQILYLLYRWYRTAKNKDTE